MKLRLCLEAVSYTSTATLPVSKSCINPTFCICNFSKFSCQFPIEYPATWIVSVTNPPVIRIRRRSCNQYQLAMPAQLLLGEDLQLLANALPMVVLVNRQIRQVTGVMEVGHGTRHAHQFVAIPRCHQQVAVVDHAFHAFAVVNRAAFAQGGAAQHVDELVCRNGGIYLVLDRHRM